MEPLAVLVTAIWAMLPAYLPNNVAVVAGGGPPIDGGRTWQGRRILGAGKTWRGTVAGIVAGIVLALLLDMGHAWAGARLGVAVPGFPITVAVALPTGAMLGDIIGSAVKRRLGRRRGSSVPILDQLDFVVGALVTTYLLAPGWSVRVLTPAVVVTIVVVTPVLHVVTNAAAYALGLKDVPW
ncbi:MAG: CDP-2,3-bis-(O-geranylgeranyl)-sn-glycerol synthase [Halobacteriaceae archaeon]